MARLQSISGHCWQGVAHARHNGDIFYEFDLDTVIIHELQRRIRERPWSTAAESIG